LPIQFTCPFCGAQTNVADRYAGQTGPCAQCGQQITIPGAPVVGPDAYVGGPAPRRSSSSAWIVVCIVVGVLGVVVVCGGILTALMLPAVQAAREAARRAQCLNNMKQISIALLNYESQHGQFPPAYVADKNGKPLYSWRVLILPYMEQSYLHDQFHLDEPWDSPANLPLSQTAMPVFQCPSNAPGDATKTDYVMIVGPDCISDGPSGRTMRDIRDGLSTTIMLAEIADSDINWAEPRDLDAKTMSYQINDPSGRPCIGSKHPRMANIALADGSVRSVNNNTDPNTVRQMTTVNDNEPKQIPSPY